MLKELEKFDYKTIDKPAEGIFKDKGSKFIARAYPVGSEEKIKSILSKVKKEYHDARHHCYAYRIGVDDEKFRINDDGEPSGTAGRPIYRKIISYDLTDILIIVIRYFGGTKLGVSGLINAYKSASNEALENAVIVKKALIDTVNMTFHYSLINRVMVIIKKHHLNVLNQDFGFECKISFEVRKKDAEVIIAKFKKIHGVKMETYKICK